MRGNESSLLSDWSLVILVQRLSQSGNPYWRVVAVVVSHHLYIYSELISAIVIFGFLCAVPDLSVGAFG